MAFVLCFLALLSSLITVVAGKKLFTTHGCIFLTYYYKTIKSLNLQRLLFKCLIGKCPGGFIEHDNNCYKVSSDKLSWNKARFACQSLEGNYDLAVVNNLELFEFLKNYNSHWIGLYSPGAKREFRWVDGSRLEFGKPVNQKPWGDNEPNVNYLIRSNHVVL